MLNAACAALSRFLTGGPHRIPVIFAGALAGALVWAGEASAAPPTGTYIGGGYGTAANAQAGPIKAALGRAGNIACPCEGTGGEIKRRQADLLEAGPGGIVLKANSIKTTVFTNETADEAVVRNTARVEGLRLLDGLITAPTVFAVAKTTVDDTNFTSSDAGSKFVGLVVDGTPIAPDVAANTEIALPGIGVVILREVITSGNGTKVGRIEVNMLHLKVNTANPFLPVGAEVIVAHAQSGFARTETEPTPIGGDAWAAFANAKIGSVLQNQIGRPATVSIGCTGTNGETHIDSIAEITVAPIITTGTGRTTAIGDPTASDASARTTATVEGVNLLSGLITANSVKAVARERFNGSVRTRSTLGSGLVGATVLGLPLPGTVPPNTTIDLPLLGHVTLNEQIIPPADSNRSTQVNGIHIFVTLPNSFGLPVGTEIIVAHARASAGKI